MHLHLCALNYIEDMSYNIYFSPFFSFLSVWYGKLATQVLRYLSKRKWLISTSEIGLEVYVRALYSRGLL